MPEQARPVTVLYFYKTHWGSHDEFVELFERNHLPILEAGVESGRLREVKRYVPHFHGDGRSDWDVLVTITYRDWAALEGGSDADIAKRLFPNQAKYHKDERRRFELLEAHWDVPLDERAD